MSARHRQSVLRDPGGVDLFQFAGDSRVVHSLREQVAIEYTHHSAGERSFQPSELLALQNISYLH